MSFTAESDTVMCNAGLTIKDDSTGAVVYEQHAEQECNTVNNNNCQTVTLSTTDAESGQKRKISTHTVSPVEALLLC